MIDCQPMPSQSCNTGVQHNKRLDALWIHIDYLKKKKKEKESCRTMSDWLHWEKQCPEYAVLNGWCVHWHILADPLFNSVNGTKCNFLKMQTAFSQFATKGTKT